MNQPATYTAIVPAAGKGSRMGNLSHSKELLPMGEEKIQTGLKQPKPVASFLFDRFRVAGVTNVHLVLRKGKSDLTDRFQSGKEWGVSLAYHLTETDLGVPFTVDEAYPFIKGQSVLFGFPDILFYPADAFKQMKDHLETQDDTDVLLGLFPVEEASRWDTVILSDRLHIEDIRIKEKSEDENRFAWIIAAWNPYFSDFMHKKTAEIINKQNRNPKEIQMGEMIRSAIREGLTVKGFPFKDGECLDIGTPEGYQKAEAFINKHGNWIS